MPGREFTGDVTFVSSQAGRESNSFAAELEAENADGTLKAGMIAQVALVRRERAGAVLVPLAAVVPRKGEHYVFAVENGRAVRKRVLLGDLIGHEAVLESGVVAGRADRRRRPSRPAGWPAGGRRRRRSRAADGSRSGRGGAGGSGGMSRRGPNFP